MSTIVQRSPEWFKARAGKVTGSRAGAILGLDPNTSRAQVLREMILEYQGLEKDFKGNVATEYGRFHEEYAQADFELMHEKKVREVGFVVSDKHEWLGASPDGLLGDDSVLEIKCPYGLREDPEPVFKKIGDLPHYYAQVQIEMICTGRVNCYFYQWSNYGSDLQIVYKDFDWIDEYLPRLYEFYEEYMRLRENPIADAEYSVLADAYRDAKDQLEIAKENLEVVKRQLIEQAGGVKAKIGGLSVYPVTRQGSVSYTKVVKDHLPELDLEPYRGKSTTTWAVK